MSANPNVILAATILSGRFKNVPLTLCILDFMHEKPFRSMMRSIVETNPERWKEIKAYVEETRTSPEEQGLKVASV